MELKEAAKELHDRVRQCFTRHQFATFGDALHWWHDIDYATQKLEAGEQGPSKFATDILWLIGLFGPKKEVDHTQMDVRKVPPLKPVKEQEETEIEEIETCQTPKKRRRRRRGHRF